MSACLSAWNSSVPTGRIFVKLDIFENPPRKSKFHPMFEIVFRIVFFRNYAILYLSWTIQLSEFCNSYNKHTVRPPPPQNTASPSFRAHESLNGSAALYSISIYRHLNIPPKILLSKQWRYIRALLYNSSVSACIKHTAASLQRPVGCVGGNNWFRPAVGSAKPPVQREPGFFLG